MPENKQVYDKQKPQYSSLWEKALSNKNSVSEMPPEADMNRIVKSERIDSPDGDTNRFCWKHTSIKQDGLTSKTKTRYYRKFKNKWGQWTSVETDKEGNALPERRVR